jgi:hypothetical protein
MILKVAGGIRRLPASNEIPGFLYLVTEGHIYEIMHAVLLNDTNDLYKIKSSLAR